MDKKEIPLKENWTLITHPDCSVFVDITDPNRYSVKDWDNNSIVTISVNKNSYKFECSMYGLNHKVNISKRTITLLHEPEAD